MYNKSHFCINRALCATERSEVSLSAYSCSGNTTVSRSRRSLGRMPEKRWRCSDPGIPPPGTGGARWRGWGGKGVIVDWPWWSHYCVWISFLMGVFSLRLPLITPPSINRWQVKRLLCGGGWCCGGVTDRRRGWWHVWPREGQGTHPHSLRCISGDINHRKYTVSAECSEQKAVRSSNTDN